MTERSMLILRGVGLLTLIGLGAYALSPKKNTKGNNGKARNNPRSLGTLKDEDLPEIKLMIARGLSKSEIAKAFGVSYSTAASFLDARGLGGKPRIKIREALIKEKIAQDLTVVEMCLELGLEKEDVLKVLRTLGVDFRSLGKSRRPSDTSTYTEISTREDVMDVGEPKDPEKRPIRFEMSSDFKVLKAPLTFENMKPYLKRGLEPCEICEFFGVTEADVRSSIDEYIKRTGPSKNTQSIEDLVELGSSQVAIALAKGMTLDEMDAYYEKRGFPIPKKLTQAELLKINKLRLQKKTNSEIAKTIGITMLRLLNFYEFFIPVPVEEIERMDFERSKDERVDTLFQNMLPYIEQNYEYFEIEEAMGLSEGGARIIIDKYIKRHRDVRLSKNFTVEDLEVFILNGYSKAHLCILTGLNTQELNDFFNQNQLNPPTQKKLTTRHLQQVRDMVLSGKTQIEIAKHFGVTRFIVKNYLDYFKIKKGSKIPRKPGNGDLAPAIAPPTRPIIPLSEDQILENAYGSSFITFRLCRDSGIQSVKMIGLSRPPRNPNMTERALKTLADQGFSIRDIAKKFGVDTYEVVRLFVKYRLNMVNKF